jgi:hypothetical protein
MFNEIECTQNIQLKRATAYLVEYMLRTQIPRDNSFFEEDACTQTEHTNNEIERTTIFYPDRSFDGHYSNADRQFDTKDLGMPDPQSISITSYYRPTF